MWGLGNLTDITDTFADAIDSDVSVNRRFILKAGLAAGATLLFPDDVEARRKKRGPKLDTEGLLYDIQLDTVTSKNEAKSRAAELEQLLQQAVNGSNGLGDAMPSNVYVAKENGAYSLIWNTDAIAETAEILLQPIGIHDISKDPKLRLRPFFYNESKTAGRFARILFDESLKNMVQELTTAYGREVSGTVRTLVKEYKKRGWFADTGYVPQKNTNIVPLPARWLKQPIINGQIKGEHYHSMTLEPGQSLGWLVANYTVGDDRKVIKELRKINEIKRRQTLYTGDTILIPNDIFRNPAEPIILTDSATSNVQNVNGQEVQSATVAKSKPTKKVPKVSEKDRTTLANKQDKTRTFIPRRIKIPRRNFDVIKDTIMPATLLEGFNLQNEQQVRHYLDKDNLKELALAYGRGIVDYKEQHVPYMSHVIIDPGHDMLYKGAFGRCNGKKHFETDFTYDIQDFLAEYLRGQGFKTHELDYTGRGKAKARIKYFTDKANSIGRKHGRKRNNYRECCYVSIHADSIKNGQPYFPRVFVPRGQQNFSLKLATSIQESAYKICDNSFKVAMLAQR